MTQQIINVGVFANDGTGDPLRTGMQKANANFTELYGRGIISITGTVNQITASASSGAITLSLPASVIITSTLTVSGLTVNSFLYSGAAGLLTTTIAPTNGQLLIGNTGNAPSIGTLTGSTGISITNGAGSITLSLATIASDTLLSNITGGIAVPLANTLTSILDAIIGNARGMMLYRSSSAWIALAAGTAGQFLQTQGTSGDPVWINEPCDIAFYFEGTMANSEPVARYVFNRTVVFPINLSGSHASADIASLGTVSFTLNKNGSSIGTVTFAASATGTFTFASSITFIAGDVLTIVAPATADSTLTDVQINLAGTR